VASRQPFNIKKPLVAAREFIFAGEKYAKGDPFPRSAPAASFNPMLIKRQYEAHAVSHAESDDPAADPVQMTGPTGGRYTITAPWLDGPEVVRGKVNAETRLAEIKAEGAPLGFIEGGSEVTVEGGEGGWFEVSAPWLAKPEKIQGREAAESRQRALHESKPEDFQPEGGKADDGAIVVGTTGDGSRPDDTKPPETPAEGDEGDAGGKDPKQPAGDADAAAGEATEGKQDPADPHKGKAEKIEGTGPAQAADDVAAAAGKATKVGASEPAAG
jgi:hypothetical protein